MSQNRKISNGAINFKDLSKEQEQHLFDAIRGGEKELKERLIESTVAKVSEVAQRCVSSEVTFEELFAAGYAAAVEAVHSFDYTEGERFNSYLSRCLEESMQQCYNNLPRFLPIDYRVIQLHDRYEIALLELYPNSPDRESDKVHHEGYIAEHLGVSVDELRTMKNEYSMCRIVSLSAPVKHDGYIDNDIDNQSPLIETIVDPASENGAAEYLDELMDCLSEEERYIVCARDGVLSVPCRTDRQIASTLGIKLNKVEALYQGAVDKLKRAGTHTGQEN